MRWGYKLNKTEIAKRMGKVRKTVDEHIAAAKAKLDRIRPNNPAGSRRGELDPDVLLGTTFDNEATESD